MKSLTTIHNRAVVFDRFIKNDKVTPAAVLIFSGMSLQFSMLSVNAAGILNWLMRKYYETMGEVVATIK
ncbi:MAG: hypothetical protein KBD44_01575 [Candidatus Pacebacteria bacterium]|nr:hypothetical protein [Candidatus Paceibacterota bacterium]